MHMLFVFESQLTDDLFYQKTANILKYLGPNPHLHMGNMLVTGLHYSPVVSIPLLFPSNSSTLPHSLPPSYSPPYGQELWAIIIKHSAG